MTLQTTPVAVCILSQSIFLISLSLKPSPHRWTLFPLILLLDGYLYFFISTNMVLKGPVLTHIFMASDYILLTSVQTQLSLVTQREPISNAPLCARFKWALNLFLSMRGVGWKHEPAHPAIPPHPSKSTSRLSFILTQLKRIAIHFLLYDLAHVIYITNPVLSLKSKLPFGDLPLLFRYTGVLGFALHGYSSLVILHACMSVFAVGLKLSEPSEWPNFFGRWGNAYTVRKFWGCVWHQTLRRIVSSHGKYLAHNILHFPPGSNQSSYTQLYVAFFLSGIIHTNSYPPTLTLAFDRRPLVFFFSQALIITFEDGMIAIFGKLYFNNQPGKFVKFMGYIWTFSWMVYSIPPWLDSMISEGIVAERGLPFIVVAYKSLF